MGGRMCSMAAAGGDEIRCHDSRRWPGADVVSVAPARQARHLRVEHLARITVPCLFVHGTRDPFGSPAELEEWTGKIPGAVTHHWIEAGTTSGRRRGVAGRRRLAGESLR